MESSKTDQPAPPGREGGSGWTPESCPESLWEKGAPSAGRGPFLKLDYDRHPCPALGLCL